MLVHMTPGEVQGLQSLALAAGGQLSINPDTGLYEANFLKKLLPTLLGFGLNFLFPGLGALGSGLLVGAGETIRTGGDLGKGLMAGLGAFGGAGLGAGLGAAAGSAAGPSTVSSVLNPKTTAQMMGATGAQTAGTEAAKQGFFNTMGKGVQALTNPAGRSAFMNAIPGGMMGLTAGGMGIANAMTPEFKPMSPEEEEQMYYQSFGYDPSQGRFLGGQFRKGYPGYPGYAMGGEVDITPNYAYPQANITKTGYSAPMEYIKPREVLDGYDAKIDPFTGEERFANGGEVGISRDAVIGNMIPPAPQQSLEQYYQSLLAPPQQPPTDNSFMDYMKGLNQFVTSPIAPPSPPQQPPQGPPNQPPGNDRVTGPGGTGTGAVYDPTTGRFVPGTGSPGDMGIDLSELQNLVNSGMFSGFNFGELSNYLNPSGYGDTSGLNWDPVSGSFMRPGSQTIFTPPGSTDENSLNMNQVQFNPNQFQFDPNAFQFNPFVQGFDMGSLPGYGMGQDMGMGQGMPGMGQGMPGMGQDMGMQPMYSGMDFGNQMGNFGLGSLSFAQGGPIQKAAAGKLVTGDGDGMSDDIRANINGDQEARLADGEFVIPADVVSHLGNGSTEAGADRLYSMMDRIRKARTGRTQQAPEVDADKYLPA